MFHVSEQTWQAIDLIEERKFQARLAQFLVANAPGLEDIPSLDHLKQVGYVIDVARSFGFSSERDIATFALSAALLGPDFHETFGGAREILGMKEPPEYRARMLEYFTREMFAVLARG